MHTRYPIRLRRVTIYDTYVEKRVGDPAAVASKYEELRRIGGQVGFLVPQVLGVDHGRSVVHLERLTMLESLRESFGRAMSSDDGLVECRAWVAAAGAALGQIHSLLGTGSGQLWIPDPSVQSYLWRYGGSPVELSNLPHASLHCDFSFANVFVQRGARPKLAIIDPCANEGITQTDWCLGPIYVDIGQFLACLEGQVKLRRQLSLKLSRITDLQHQFVESYNRNSPHELDLRAAFAFAYAAAARQFEFRYGRASWIATSALYNATVKRNFPLENKMRVFTHEP